MEKCGKSSNKMYTQRESVHKSTVQTIFLWHKVWTRGGGEGEYGEPSKNKWNERRAQQFKRNNKRHSFLSFKCIVIISCCWIILVSRIESINMWLVNRTHTVASLQNADSDALNNPNVAVHMLWFKAI